MKRPERGTKKPESAVEIFDFPQGSPEWFAARLGIPTASKFSDVMAKGEGKTRRTYMTKLAGEIISGSVADHYRNADMDRGNEWEAEARDAYAFARGVEVRQVGFIRNGRKGASPDGLVGDDGGVEIKTMAPHLMVELLLADRIPPEHLPQLQGNIWTSDRKWWDLCIYSRKFPPFIKTVARDSGYIARLEIGVSSFCDELEQMVAEVRRYGQPRSAI